MRSTEQNGYSQRSKKRTHTRRKSKAKKYSQKKNGRDGRVGLRCQNGYSQRSKKRTRAHRKGKAKKYSPKNCSSLKKIFCKSVFYELQCLLINAHTLHFITIIKKNLHKKNC